MKFPFRYGLSEDQSQFTAQFFPGYGETTLEQVSSPEQRVGVLLDIETTGFYPEKDEIIEIAARKFLFDRETGELVSLGSSFSAFHQPKKSIPPHIVELTGINDRMVEGTSIDWEQFDRFISDSAVVIAHNAYFDRPFVDLYSQVSNQAVWGCSQSQIPWRTWFPSTSLFVLSLVHGYFVSAHRALNDVDATLRLLTFSSPNEQGSPYLRYILDDSRIKRVLVFARFDYGQQESRDIISKKGFRFDRVTKSYKKEVPEPALSDTLELIESLEGKARVQPIARNQRFKKS